MLLEDCVQDNQLLKIAVRYYYIPPILKFQGTTVSRAEFHEMCRFADYYYQQSEAMVDIRCVVDMSPSIPLGMVTWAL